MSVYKVGDRLINRQTKKICEITQIIPIHAGHISTNVYMLDKYDTYFIKDLSNSFDKLDDSCPVVRLLYYTISNK